MFDIIVNYTEPYEHTSEWFGLFFKSVAGFPSRSLQVLGPVGGSAFSQTDTFHV